MSQWQLFFREIQQDFKLYIYMLGVFSIFRIGFIVVLHTYLNSNTTLQDILIVLYYGLRISLKSAGVITLLSFLLCTLPAVFFTGNIIRKNRYYLGSIYIFVLSILFQIRIPYYEQFHIGYNQFMFNALHDDMSAIFFTFIQHYNFFPKFAVAIFITLLLIKGLHFMLNCYCSARLSMPCSPTWP